MSNTRKRSPKREHIKVWCTADQKARVLSNAQRNGAKSTSEYLLTLGLNGLTEEYSSARRKEDGPLLNAEVYLKLFNMIEALQQRPDAGTELVEEAIALIHEVRRDIAINRLRHNAEREFA